jgi:hypothetical protein
MDKQLGGESCGWARAPSSVDVSERYISMTRLGAAGFRGACEVFGPILGKTPWLLAVLGGQKAAGPPSSLTLRCLDGLRAPNWVVMSTT